jgi:hypothetical protein
MRTTCDTVASVYAILGCPAESDPYPRAARHNTALELRMFFTSFAGAVAGLRCSWQAASRTSGQRARASADVPPWSTDKEKFALLFRALRRGFRPHMAPTGHRVPHSTTTYGLPCAVAQLGSGANYQLAASPTFLRRPRVGVPRVACLGAIATGCGTGDAYEPPVGVVETPVSIAETPVAQKGGGGKRVGGSGWKG